MKISFVKYFAVVLVLFCQSCVYHLGSENGLLSKVYVEDVLNKTEEPELGGMLHSAVAELLGTAPTARSRKECGLALEVLSLENRGWARAEIRDKRVRDDDSDAYQTVLYRIRIKVRYSVKDHSGKLHQGIVEGLGNLPKMHDRNIPLQYALKLAADDAAKKIVDAISDADVSAGAKL